MKPDYKNWFPAKFVYQRVRKALIPLFLAIVFGAMGVGGLPVPIRLVMIFCFTMAAVWFGYGAWELWLARKAMDLTDSRSLAWKIVKGVASYVELPPKGKCLDIGCGSGALTLAVAKSHPDAVIIGTDPWDPKVTPDVNQKLCQDNAKAEGASHVVFMYGIAQKVEFPDNTFDAVISNYVYHHVRGMDRVDTILEALRTLKPGGVFVIHDLMTKGFYGDRDILLKRVLESGCREARLIPTDNGLFMTRKEASRAILTGSCLLVGRK